MTGLKYLDIKKMEQSMFSTCLGKEPKYNHLKWTWKMEEWTLNTQNKPLKSKNV